MAKKKTTTRMIAIRVVDGPLAAPEAFCVPADCFKVEGEHATVRLELPMPPGLAPGAGIPVHEYRIAAEVFASRYGRGWSAPKPKGPTLAHWVRRVEDRVLAAGAWYPTERKAVG